MTWRNTLLGLSMLLGSVALAACGNGSASTSSSGSTPTAHPAPSSQGELPVDAASSVTPTQRPASERPNPTTAILAEPVPVYDGPNSVDLWIKNGNVYDGSGVAGAAADVVVVAGKIVFVGPMTSPLTAKETIDAKGLAVAPGFIDAHSHGHPKDSNLNALSMGVTTICIGQDGSSQGHRSVKNWIGRNKTGRFGVNLAPFVGHATLRQLTGAGTRKNLSEARIDKMRALLKADLAAGAFGLTTGLEYVPGTMAGKAELVGLAKEVAVVDGLVMSHLRSEDDDTIDAALDELLAQAYDGGARVHVSHIKVVYGKGTARADQLIERFKVAGKRGVKMTADIYPYLASYTGIAIVFPAFALEPHDYRKVKRTKRKELAAFIRDKVNRRNGPEATLFGTGKWSGKTLKQVADEAGKPFEDVLIDDIGPRGASAAYFVMNKELQTRLLQFKMVMISTDGGGTSSHPRGYGAFARVLRRDVREDQTLLLTEAIRKMTSLPAHTLRLHNRGQLKKGFAADIVIFDPRTVADRSTFKEPRKLAKGFRWVFVNGQAAIKDGRATGRRGGSVLLKLPTAK